MQSINDLHINLDGNTVNGITGFTFKVYSKKAVQYLKIIAKKRGIIEGDIKEKIIFNAPSEHDVSFLLHFLIGGMLSSQAQAQQLINQIKGGINNGAGKIKH